MGYASCRSRVRPVCLSEPSAIVGERGIAAAAAAALALVVSSLVFLFLEDRTDRDLSPLTGAAPIGKLLEAPGAKVFLPVADHMERLQYVFLRLLLVFLDEPACEYFLVRKVPHVQDRSDHDNLIKGDRFRFLDGFV